MLWRPINFQGVVAVDKDLVDQLQQYLGSKERLLAQKVAIAFAPEKEEAPPPLELTVGEAASFAKDSLALVVQNQSQGLSGYDIKSLVQNLNKALWDYVEVLEGAAVEFLQQLDHVRLDRLTIETLQSVDAVKVLMIDKIRASREVVVRLERILSDYRDVSRKEESWVDGFLKSLPWKRLHLDHALLNHLDKTTEALVTRDRRLKDSYQEFNRLSIKVKGSRQRIEGYEILKKLDLKNRERFIDVYSLLKMWSANGRSRSIPERDLVRILRMKAPVEQVSLDFKCYFESLTEALYEQSRQLKNQNKVSDSKRRETHDLLRSYSRELHSLGSSVSRFRDFLLRTNPDPYVRARWGFSERITGTEPSETKALQKLRFSIEALDELYQKMLESLESPAVTEPFRSTPLYQHLQDAVHELGQPLASRGLMRKRGDALVDLLEEVDELGSSDSQVVEYVGELLSKAMRADWKYHALHEVPDFCQLYNVHMGITGLTDLDPSEKELIEQWKELQAVIKKWVTKGSVWCFPQEEVEEAAEGLKQLLRECLLSIDELVRGQRGEALSISVAKKRQQLLQLRFLFGQFCLKQLQAHPEGGLLRNHFLFVDQYFEFMENKLNDLEATAAMQAF